MVHSMIVFRLLIVGRGSTGDNDPPPSYNKIIHDTQGTGCRQACLAESQPLRGSNQQCNPTDNAIDDAPINYPRYILKKLSAILHYEVTTHPYIQANTVVTRPRPKDYTVPAVLACFCCCWPIGICAIIYAYYANSAADHGDMARAIDKAKTARNLTIAAVVFGIVWIAVAILLEIEVAYRST